MNWQPTRPGPPGWYPNPGAPGIVRWWDGYRWTERTAPSAAVAAPPMVPIPSYRARPASPTPWIIAAGGLLAVIGSILPWATVRSAFGQIDVAGTEGDGVLTLVLGVVVVILGLSSRVGARQVLAILALLPALGIGGIAAYDLVNITEMSDELSGTFVQASAGPGLWVVLGGAAVALVGGIIGAANG